MDDTVRQPTADECKEVAFFARTPEEAGRERQRTMADTSERRRVVRVIISSHLRGQLLGSQEVRVLDLSPAGARIEHVDPMRPGTTCTLEFPPLLGSLQLTARLIWSQVSGGEQTPEGERRLHYQSGLVFLGVRGEQAAVLADALEM